MWKPGRAELEFYRDCEVSEGLNSVETYSDELWTELTQTQVSEELNSVETT